MRKCELPSREQCLEILKELCVPSHIVRHGFATAKLGLFLAIKLNERGISVDVDLVDRACLLHDVLRVCDLRDYSRFEHSVTDKAKWMKLKSQYEGLCHEEAAAAFFRGKYPQLAEVIRKHRYTAISHPQDKPQTWEEKLVYYADKRVMHDKIVPLKERLEEAHKRIAAQRDPADQGVLDMEQIDAFIFDLEREIFDKIEVDPLVITDEFIDLYDKVEQ